MIHHTLFLLIESTIITLYSAIAERIPCNININMRGCWLRLFAPTVGTGVDVAWFEAQSLSHNSGFVSITPLAEPFRHFHWVHLVSAPGGRSSSASSAMDVADGRFESLTSHYTNIRD